MLLNNSNTSLYEIIIFIWFASSVLIAVVGNFAFWIWLRRRGIKLIFGLVGTPGYLDYVYLKWCREQGRSGKAIIILRVLSVSNVIAAGIVFILYVTSKQ